MRLGKYFNSEEFHEELPQDMLQNYFLLVQFVLDKVRDRFGVVTITSGYRDKDYNEKIGGSPTSQHVTGEACDFVCPYSSMGLVYRFILDELEWPGETILYPRRGHIHVALPHIGVKADQFIKEEA